MAKLGATSREIAQALDVNETTLWRWSHQNQKFSNALKVGKDEADERVVQSLYRSATGYSFDSEKIFQQGGKVIRAPFVEHVPPHPTSCIFWLKNRRPDVWRDRQEHDLSVTLTDAEQLGQARERAKVRERLPAIEMRH